MREYLFRGKRIDNGEWVDGDLVRASEGKSYIVEDCETNCDDGETTDLFATSWYEVDPATVGQFTGLLDKNGKRIFEGDICRDNTGDIVQIVWSKNHSWGCKIIKGCTLSLNLTFPLWQWDNCRENGFRKIEVIGNIHDNQELLGGAE